MTREQQMARQVQELQATVNTLLTNLNQAQEMIDSLEAQLREAKDRIVVLESILDDQIKKAGENMLLLVVVGPGPGLVVDLASLRKVQASTRLQITRLLPASKESLKRTLERHRKRGQPIRYVHMAVHAGPEGIQLDGGLADGLWLSEILADVQVLFLAGCEGDVVADLLGVVPAVVSLREMVDDHDATVFAEVFWHEIGRGLPANIAYERTLRRCPPAVAEFAELHQ